MTIIKKATLVIGNPYVTDGLVAHFDGIWNAGLGRNDPAATEWTDLVTGERTTSTAENSFSSNALIIRPEAKSITLNSPAAVAAFSNDSFTLEIVGAINNIPFPESFNWLYSPEHISLTTYKDKAGLTSLFRTVKLGDLMNLASHGTCNVPYAAYGSFALDYKDKRALFYLNDTYITSRNTFQKPSPKALYISSGANGPSGSYHALRIYNRRLSKTEMLTNYEIDYTRFHLTPTTNH